MNQVYWLTGLSGAGKTTIGRLWYKKLRAAGEAVVFLVEEPKRPDLVLENDGQRTPEEQVILLAEASRHLDR